MTVALLCTKSTHDERPYNKKTTKEHIKSDVGLQKFVNLTYKHVGEAFLVL